MAAPDATPTPPARRRQPAAAPPTRRPYPREPREGFTAVGRVLRPHGLKGELRVQGFSEGAPNLQTGRSVYLAGERLLIEAARPERDAWLIQLAGIAGRTAAERWRGALLEVPDADVQRADEESYFIHELVGLSVVSEGGRELGTLAEVLQAGSADVYVVRGDRGELLIPAIADVVKEIDLLRRRLTITPLAGLLDEPE